MLTFVDRAALAAYCQAYGRWVEAEQKLAETPTLIKAPSGYIQQSPWLSVANKQMELMGRCMAELGITPASRSRIALSCEPMQEPVRVIIRRFTEAPDVEIEADCEGVHAIEYRPGRVVYDA